MLGQLWELGTRKRSHSAGAERGFEMPCRRRGPRLRTLTLFPSSPRATLAGTLLQHRGGKESFAVRLRGRVTPSLASCLTPGQGAERTVGINPRTGGRTLPGKEDASRRGSLITYKRATSRHRKGAKPPQSVFSVAAAKYCPDKAFPGLSQSAVSQAV